MQTDSGAVASLDPQRATSVLDRAPRAALVTFVVVEAVGLGLFLYFGRDQWFWWDEWELLAGRNASVHDLLAPYHGHWVGGPVIVYRTLWSVFGLHTYVPYQLIAISTHLGLAALLRVVMRRASVAPWIATATAGAFVLFGTGKQNIMWGFQIAFTAPLLLGIIHLLLADHEGRVDWRDALGLFAGVIALACSGVGAAMIVAVGCSTFLRRGVRRAALHVTPLVAVFAAWWVGYGRHDSYGRLPVQAWTIVRFVFGGVEATLHSVGQLPGTSWLLVAILVVGLAFAWRRQGQAAVRFRAAEPLALLLAALAFLAMTAWGRAQAIQMLTGELIYLGRYRHVVAALMLPALAVAVDAIARRWRAGALVVLVPILVGVPLNVREIEDRDPFERREFGEPDLFGAILASSLLDEVPGDVRPFPEGPVGVNVVTVDWIRRERDAGRLPQVPDEVDPMLQANARLRLSIAQGPAPPTPRSCQPLSEPLPWRLDPGESVSFTGRVVQVQGAVEGSRSPASVTYSLSEGGALTAVAGPLDVTFVPRGAVRFCG